jgi:signal peptidase I
MYNFTRVRSLDIHQTVNPPEKTEEEKTNGGRLIRDILETFVLAVLLFAGINAVSARVRVDGFSMRPTLQDGEFVLVNKLAYRLGEVQRGDIIVFHYPSDPSQELIKG